MKRGKKCGEVKPLAEFYLAAGMADGYRSECKACHKAKQRSWYEANREHAIAEAADYVSSDQRPSVLELELALAVRERALALREVSA